MHHDNGVTRSPRARQALRALGLLTAATLLAGCGFVNTPEPEESGSGTLTATVNTEQNSGLVDLIAAFEEESGITVDVESAATADLNEQLRVELTSGTAPDVFRVSPGSSSAIAARLLGSAGNLAPMEGDWLSLLPDSARALSEVDGDVYAFPLSQNVIVMTYNTEVFDSLGLEVPTTWSEFLDVCATLKAAGIVPISAGFTGGIFLQFIVYALAASNVYAVNPDIDAQQEGSATAFSDSPEWREVFEKFKALADAGYFTEGANGIAGEQAMQAVASGQAGMISMVSAQLPVMTEFAESPDDLAVFAMPGTDDPSQTRLPVAPDFLGINASAANPDAAKDFIAFLARPENVKAYSSTLGVLPGLAIDVPIPAQLAGVEAELADGSTAPYANYTWPNGDTQQRLLQSGQQLISGEITVDQLLEQLDVEFAKGTP